MELENLFSDQTFFLFFPSDKVRELTSIIEAFKLTGAKVVILQNRMELSNVLHNPFSTSNPKPDAIIYDENFTGFGPPVEMIICEIEPVSVFFRTGHDPIVHAEHKKTLSLFVGNALSFIRYKEKEEVKV